MYTASAFRPLVSCPRAQRNFHFLLSRRALGRTYQSRPTAHGATPSPIIKTAVSSHLWDVQSVSPSCHVARRSLHTTPWLQFPPAPPKSKDRGPVSKEETQTDFGAMDIFSGAPPPTTGIDACLDNGFALNSGLRITGAGVLLYGGEAFKWQPWRLRADEADSSLSEQSNQATRQGDVADNQQSTLLNARGMWEVSRRAWGIIDLSWPRPDLLILGTGKRLVPLSPKTRADLVELGVRVEVQDSRNAAAQFNLLATERGTQQVAAALLPVGWV